MNLPTWAKYVIAGLSTTLLLTLGIVGGLLRNDRATVDTSLTRIERMLLDQHSQFNLVLQEQSKQITEVAKHNERQNHIMDKMCWLLTLSYPERMKLFQNYPTIMEPKSTPRFEVK